MAQTKANKYAGLDAETFDRLLREVIDGDNCTASQILMVPGVYEVLSEYYNNEVLERWELEQAENEPDDDSEEG